MAFIPNFPAPERANGEYTGPGADWTNDGVNAPVAKGIQPQGDNNPAGDIPGIIAMSITAAVAATLEGPQGQ